MGRNQIVAARPAELWARMRNENLVRNNAIYFAGSVLTGGFGYMFHFVTGRLLGPAGYGVVASAIAAVYLLTLPSLIVQLVAARFASVAIAEGDPGRVRHLLARLTAVSIGAGALVALVMVVLAPQATRYLQLGDRRIVYVLAATTLLGLLVSANRGVIQGFQRFVVLSANTLLDALARVPVAVALILAGLGPIGGVVGIVAGPALAYIHSLFLLRRLEEPGQAKAVTMGEVARYAAPAAIAVIGVTYLFNVDVILAKHFLSPHDAGIYAAGSVLARAVYFLGITVAGVMFPEVAGRHARDEAHYHVVDRSLAFLAAVGAVMTAAYLLVPGLVLFPYGSSFDAVRPYLAPFAVALSLLALANLLVNYFLSVNSGRFILPLLGACVLQAVLILAFHQGVAQVLSMLMITTASLLAALGLVYGLERRRRAGRPAAAVDN